MSAGGRGDLVHGAQIPSPPWWRPFRDVPLVILAVLSVIAALVGWSAQFYLDSTASQPAPVDPTPGATIDSAVAAACRAPVDGPGAEPWISGDGSAERVWADNADNLSAPVVAGRDGWAFYNDQIEENFSQSVGRRFLTVGEVESWKDYFTTVADGLAAEGIELSIQVTPSAASVYPQQLPEWTESIQGSTPFDQLLAAAPDLPLVDFRADLRAASEEDAVFTPVNSHWTDWGGYIGWNTYAACHEAMDPSGEALWVPEVESVRSTGVFNEYGSFGVEDAEPEWTVPEFTDEFLPVEVVSASGATEVEGEAVVDLSILPVTTKTEGAHSAQTALILRDSMGNALSPYWGQQFAETRQLAHRYDDWSSPPNFRALVDQYRPDVVIVQLAERHLVNAPTAPSGY